MKNKNRIQMMTISSFPLNMFAWEREVLFANPSGTEVLSGETENVEKRSQVIQQYKDALTKLSEDSPNYKLSKPQQFLDLMGSDSVTLRVTNKMKDKLAKVSAGQHQRLFNNLAKENQLIEVKASMQDGTRKFACIIGKESCFFESDDVKDASVYAIEGITIEEQQGIESAVDKEQRRKEVIDALKTIANLDATIKSALEKNGNPVLVSMVQNLVDMTASRWSTDSALQARLKDDFQKQATDLQNEFNSFVDSNRRNLDRILADGKAKVEFKMKNPSEKNAIDLLKSRVGWGAFTDNIFTELEEQTHIIGMTMERLRHEITDSPGDKELKMGELIDHSNLKGKEWDNISIVEKAALARILIAVNKLKEDGSIKRDSTVATSAEQPEVTPVAEIPTEVNQDVTKFREQVREFQSARDSLMNDEAFHGKVREYVKGMKAVLHGSQVYFGNSFDGVKVTIKSGREQYEMDLGESTLHFVSPDKAKAFWEKVNSPRKERSAPYIIPIEDLIKTSDGKVKVTTSPDVLDWSVLEEGWNGAKQLYRLLNDSTATPQQKLEVFQLLEQYREQNPHYFTMEDTLKTKTDLSSAEKDIVSTVQAVEVVIALYHNPQNTTLKNKAESILMTNGRSNMLGIETLVKDYIDERKTAGDQRLTKFDQAFLNRINYGLEDSVEFEYHVKGPDKEETQTISIAPREGQTFENYLQMIQDWVKANPGEIAAAGLANFHPEWEQGHQGIDRGLAMQYFKDKQEMRNAIQVVDHRYATESENLLVFTREARKGRKWNSNLGESTFEESYELQGTENLDGLGDALRQLRGSEVPKGDMEEFLNGAKLDLIGIDQGKQRVDQNIDGFAFAKSALDSGHNKRLFIDGDNFKKVLIAKSDSAKALKEEFKTRLPQNLPEGASIEIDTDREHFSSKDLESNWVKLFDIALVAIPGRLNESIAFKLKDVKIKITTPQKEEKEYRERIGVTKPQMLVVDVFNTYKVRNFPDWVGKLFTSPGKLHGDLSGLYKDMIDSSGVLPVGRDKPFEERVPKESRVKTKLTETQGKMKEIVEKMEKTDITVGDILDVNKAKGVADRADLSEKELKALRERTETYTREDGYQRPYFDKLDSKVKTEYKNMTFKDFKAEIMKIKSVEDNRLKPDIYYKDGETTMAITEQMLKSPRWMLQMKMGNNIFQLIVDRYKLPKISEREFIKLQEDGQIPEKINGKPFRAEMFSALIQGKGMDTDMVRYVLGQESGILKTGQPVQVDRTVLGMIILSVITWGITTYCVKPEFELSGWHDSGGW